MDLQQLRAIGAIKDRRLVKRRVTVSHFPHKPVEDWADPDIPEFASEKVEHTFDVFVRKRSSADTIEMVNAEPRMAPLLMVLRCIADHRGEQVFPTLDDVASLEEWMFVPLYNAAGEANQLSPKASPPKTSSGATSPSDSGAEASPSGKTPSTTTSEPSGSSTDASAEP